MPITCIRCVHRMKNSMALLTGFKQPKNISKKPGLSASPKIFKESWLFLFFSPLPSSLLSELFSTSIKREENPCRFFFLGRLGEDSSSPLSVCPGHKMAHEEKKKKGRKLDSQQLFACSSSIIFYCWKRRERERKTQAISSHLCLGNLGDVRSSSLSLFSFFAFLLWQVTPNGFSSSLFFQMG